MVLDETSERYIRACLVEGRDVTRLSPTEARALERSGRERYGVGPDMARVENIELPVSGGAITVRVVYPVQRPTAVVVYFHGGGWVTGEIGDYDALLRTLAREAGCAIALVEYRKAPECPFPAAVHDAIQATHWLADNVAKRMAAPSGIIVAGDSAGGNLAAAVAQSAVTGAAPTPLLQILIYPVLDCDFTTRSYVSDENQLLLTREAMQWYWNHYAPDPADRLNPLASPARAVSVAGLPPALVITAEHDVLRSEGDDYARRLRDEGVEVEHVTFGGQAHGFFSLHNVLPASAAARRLIADTIKRHVARR